MVTIFRRNLPSQSSGSKKSKSYISWGNSDSKSVGLVAWSPHLTSHGVTTTSKTNLNFLWLIYLLHPCTLLILFHVEHPSLSAPLNFPMHSMHGPLTAQQHHHHSPWLATPVTLPHITYLSGAFDSSWILKLKVSNSSIILVTVYHWKLLYISEDLTVH